MTKTIAKTYDIANENRARITMVIFVMCAFLAVFYAFKVYSVVRQTLAIEQDSKEASSLSSSVSGLDSTYLGLIEQATPDALSSYGLKAGNVAAYIDRRAPTASLGGLASAGHEL